MVREGRLDELIELPVQVGEVAQDVATAAVVEVTAWAAEGLLEAAAALLLQGARCL